MGSLEAVILCIDCARQQGVLSSFDDLGDENGTQEKKGKNTPVRTP